MGKKQRGLKRKSWCPRFTVCVVFLVLILVISYFVMNFVFVVANKNYLYDFTPEYTSLEVISPLEKYFMNIFKEQAEGDKPFYGVVMPKEQHRDFGSDYFGLVNMILYCIFTKSTFFIPRKSFFGEEEKYPWSKFFKAKNFDLQNYIQFPPADEVMRNNIMNSNNHCLQKLSSPPPDIFEYLQGVENGADINFMEEYYFRDRTGVNNNDIFRTSRIVNDDISQSLFEENHHILFHDPFRKDEGYNFLCFNPWKYGYYIYHVFKSEKKLEFLCSLSLCEGIDVEEVKQYREEGYIRYGTILASNILKSLFKLNFEDWEKSVKEFEDTNIKKGSKVIGVDVKEEYTREHTSENIIECLLKLLDSEYEKRDDEGKEVTVYFTSSTYQIDRMVIKKLVLEFEQRKLFLRKGYRNLHVITSASYWPNEDAETPSSPYLTKEQKEESYQKHTKHTRIFLDLYFMSKASTVVMTQMGSNGMLASAFSENNNLSPYYLFPYMTGRPLPDYYYDIAPCSKKAPYHPCPFNVCPFEYN